MPKLSEYTCWTHTIDTQVTSQKSVHTRLTVSQPKVRAGLGTSLRLGTLDWALALSTGSLRGLRTKLVTALWGHLWYCFFFVRTPSCYVRMAR
jgi:hypothetical protein